MNTETIKVLGDLKKISLDADVQRVLQNLIITTLPIMDIDLKTLFEPVEILVPIDEEESEKVSKDLRIRWLIFQNFRSVPYVSVKEKPYGISFSDEKNDPRSLYLVGRNGTGKTTLFSALEHHYLSDSSLSKNMNVDSKHIMSYGFEQVESSKDNEPSISLETVSEGEVKDTLEKKSVLCSPAPFCSEYDIQQLATKGSNLFDYLLQQLGYQELKDICNLIDNLINSIDEDLKSGLKDETPELEASDYDQIIIELLNNYKQAKTIFGHPNIKSLYERHFSKFMKNEIPSIFRDYWDRQKRRNVLAGSLQTPAEQFSQGESVLKERANALSEKLRVMYNILETSLRELVLDSGTSNLHTVLENLYNDKSETQKNKTAKILSAEDHAVLTKQRTVLLNVKSQIREQRGMIVDEFIEGHFPMLKKIMSFFSNNDGELIKPKQGLESLVINIKARGESGGEFVATPQEYYNSFRYKLYAVSFKIALAFTEMSKKNILVPIVIDDVFSASDFENNLRLEYFVYNIYDAYRNLGFDQPLQLILLTHDEMVQTAFRRGTDLIIDEDNRDRDQADLKNHNYVCGRLYSYKYAKDMAMQTGTTENEKFYNLYITN